MEMLLDAGGNKNPSLRWGFYFLAAAKHQASVPYLIYASAYALPICLDRLRKKSRMGCRESGANGEDCLRKNHLMLDLNYVCVYIYACVYVFVCVCVLLQVLGKH
jgi:hypothetical protein